MKKTLTYFILVLFLFNSIGYYLLFEIHKSRIKQEMEAMIQRKYPEKLTLLAFDDIEKNKEFQRIDKKEFRYRGAMYDIVRESKTGKRTIFICMHDAKESKLFAGLKRETQNKIHLARWDHMIMICLSNPTIGVTCPELPDLIFPHIKSLLPSPEIRSWSPPPEFS